MAVIPCSQADVESETRRALFQIMAERRMRYALRENAIHQFGHGKVDIVIDPRNLSECCAIVREIVRSIGLYVADYYVKVGIKQFTLVGRNFDGGLRKITIRFSICSEIYGIQYLSAHELLCDVRINQGVPVVSDSVLLLDKWMFKLLTGRPLDTKYDADFAAIAMRNRALLIRHLTRFLPAARAVELVDRLARGAGSKILLAARERRRALIWLWLAQGACALARSARFLGNRLRNWLRPHGVFLSVSGPDGSGKTTVIDIVVAQLRAIYGDDAVHYAHFRPTMLPRIAEVAKKAGAVESVDDNYDRPHRAKPSGLTGSAVRLAYYWLDYMGGYFRSVRPVLKRREVMLFDRYYYDMIADSFRSRIALPLPLLLAVGWILPLPHYAFFIHVAPEEIHRRKQELTFERIVTLNARYGDLVQRRWLIAVDNNGAPQKAAAAIVDRILADRHGRAPRALL